VARLGCNLEHCFHDECFKKYLEFQKANEEAVLCPICMALYDESEKINCKIGDSL
jgi:hypothetical protein